MATYGETARSNYFAVKDPEAWKTFCERWGVADIDEKGLYGFVSSDGITSWQTKIDANGDEVDDEDADFDSELEAQLVDGEVCVIQAVGNEAHCYVIGYAKAISPGRDMIYFDLQQIYDMVEEQWGVTPTGCEY
jgi:hypothetical protein